MKQPRRQPRKKPRSRPPPRERKSSFESFTRLDKSAVIILILAFCVIHWAIRVFTGPVYTIEEADQLLFSQSLQVGYEARQPPLLAWLHALAIGAGGMFPPIVFAVKYLLLFVALTFYYLAARNVLIKPGVSAAAVAAWALTFQVGWGVHEDLLGATALMACLSLTLHAFTRILTWRRYRDWVYLGCAIGLGLLTHHLFVVFPVAMLIGIVMSPFFRDAVNPGRFAVTLLVVALIYGPYAFWVSTHIGSVSDAAREYVTSWEIDSAWLDRVGVAAAGFGRTLLEFTLPLSLFWLMLFWGLWLPILYPMFGRRSTDEEPHEVSWRKLFAMSMMLGVLAYLAAVVFGVQTYKGYWMMPALFTAPIWMFAHVKRAGDFPVAIRAFAAVVIAFAALVVTGRFIEWKMEVTMCDECRSYTPVREWARELKEAGFGQGTIVGADKHLTGNLRGAFPKTRVLDASIPVESFPTPSPRARGACLAVWRDEPIMPEALADYLEQKLGAGTLDREPQLAISANLLQTANRSATLYYRFVGSTDLCR
ncbi:MAG: glycosyltransferase family 39 protein [Hyphomonadaceae bacterium]|nr:glycosyltransferase family 39 protein [Hyphomonadaceae bacterium]